MNKLEKLGTLKLSESLIEQSQAMKKQTWYFWKWGKITSFEHDVMKLEKHIKIRRRQSRCVKLRSELNKSEVNLMQLQHLITELKSELFMMLLWQVGMILLVIGCTCLFL